MTPIFTAILRTPRHHLPYKSILRNIMSGPSTSKRISLNPTEEKFCALLDDFSKSYDPPVECRIAGGWVRDKLLSLPSVDLDIALPLTSGYAFALSFVTYLKDQHAGIAVGSVGKVAANPEQSKHLETGTTRIMGLECDFVGLRSERYTDSRIPDEVKLGTPEEDALRRDLTINALFYNVSTESIEDFTKCGLVDLENRIARTPLPPKQTYMDDPLRVLRTIRFAGRFGLKVDDEAVEAARELEVQAALKTKVSKERVGIEIAKTLLKSPLLGLRLISDLRLHDSIFTCPGLDKDLPREEAIKMAEVLDEVLKRWQGPVEGVEHLWLAAALKPFEGEVVKGKKEMPAVSMVVAEGLKLSTDINRAVSNLYIAQTLLEPLAQGRSEIGVILQSPAVRPWRRSIVWTLAQRILPIYERDHGWSQAAEEEMEVWRRFVRKIEGLRLEEAIDKPSLVDGKSLLSLLSIKPSPVVQFILKSINIWQLDHPAATKEECEIWVNGMWKGPGRAEWEEAAAKLIGEGKGKDKGKDKGEKRKR